MHTSTFMHVYTATIGRNVGQAPMPDERWQKFEADTMSALMLAAEMYQPGVGITEIHRGEGYWEGTKEESTKLTILLNEPLGADHVRKLRANLSDLAYQYDQDAIALTIGKSELRR